MPQKGWEGLIPDCSIEITCLIHLFLYIRLIINESWNFWACVALEISEEHPCTKNINRILRTEKTSLLATKKILLMRTYFLTYSISLFVCYAWVIVCLGNLSQLKMLHLYWACQNGSDWLAWAHFSPMFHFYTPWIRQKAKGCLRYRLYTIYILLGFFRVRTEYGKIRKRNIFISELPLTDCWFYDFLLQLLLANLKYTEKVS